MYKSVLLSCALSICVATSSTASDNEVEQGTKVALASCFGQTLVELKGHKIGCDLQEGINGFMFNVNEDGSLKVGVLNIDEEQDAPLMQRYQETVNDVKAQLGGQVFEGGLPSFVGGVAKISSLGGFMQISDVKHFTLAPNVILCIREGNLTITAPSINFNSFIEVAAGSKLILQPSANVVSPIAEIQFTPKAGVVYTQGSVDFVAPSFDSLMVTDSDCAIYFKGQEEN